MLGSSASISDTNTMLNTAVADVLCRFANRLESAKDFESELNAVLREAISAHKHIIFNGDGYSKEWQDEATTRGLHNLRSTVDAIPALLDQNNVDLFERHGVLNRTEMNIRVDIALENYSKIIHIEALTLVEMMKRDIIPAISAYCDRLCQNVAAKRAVRSDINCTMETTLIDELTDANAELFTLVGSLEESVSRAEKADGLLQSAKLYRYEVLETMQKIRRLADRAETVTARDYWPYPAYGDLLFKI